MTTERPSEKPMRVIVCGSRTWKNTTAIRLRIAQLPEDAVIVHGACPTGADAIAQGAARALNMRVERHPANWGLGRRAGPLRNREMAELGADLCVAFWDVPSRGTANMVSEALAHGIPVECHYPDGTGEMRLPEAAQ